MGFPGKLILPNSITPDRFNTTGYVPSAAGDLTTVQYVTSLFAGLTPKGEAKASTTPAMGNINLNNPPAIFDGYSPADGEVIVVQHQNNPVQNGLYDYHAGGMVRSANFNTTITVGAYVLVDNGTLYGGWGFFVSGIPSSGQTIVIGTDDVIWSLYQKPNTYVGGDGITVNANQINLGGTFANDINLDGAHDFNIGLTTKPTTFRVFAGGSDYAQLFMGSTSMSMNMNIGGNTVGGIIFDANGANIAGPNGATSIQVGGNSNFKIIDSRSLANAVGIEYAADYSVNYTARSLVDKGYVDGAIAGAYTFSNGITNTAGAVKFGGPLTADTSVDLTTHNMTFGSNTASGQFNVSTSGSITFTINSGGNGFFIDDSFTGAGFNYNDGDAQGGVYITTTGGFQVVQPNFLDHSMASSFSLQHPDNFNAGFISFISNTGSRTNNGLNGNVQPIFRLTRQIGSATTVLNGLGLEMKLQLENSNHITTQAGIQYALTNVTAGSEQGQYAFALNVNSVNETIISELDQYGWRYMADYSANWTNRSLVDKAYVDGAISSGSVTASNGLTKTGGNITWGGTLTQDTAIDGAYNLAIGQTTNLTGFELFVNGANGINIAENGGTGFILNSQTGFFRILSSSARIYAQQTFMNFEHFDVAAIQYTRTGANAGTAKFFDNRTVKVGFEYGADYSANYTNRSLVDKAYVDGAISTSGWTLNGTSSLTGNVVINAANHDLTIGASASKIGVYTSYAASRAVYATTTATHYVDSSFVVRSSTSTSTSLTIDTAAGSIDVQSNGTMTLQSLTAGFNIISPGTYILNIAGSVGTAGQVLTSDGTSASWQSGATTVTASNGLTKVVNDIQLGGTLTSNIFIDGDGVTPFNFNIGQNQTVQGFYVAAGDFAAANYGGIGIRNDRAIFDHYDGGVNTSRIFLDAAGMHLYGGNRDANAQFTQIDLGNSDNPGIFVITDNRTGANQEGIVYAANYAANFTARSLVDKGYVDAKFAFGAATQIPFVNATADGFSYSANFTFLPATNQLVGGGGGSTAPAGSQTITWGDANINRGTFGSVAFGESSEIDVNVGDGMVCGEGSYVQAYGGKSFARGGAIRTGGDYSLVGGGWDPGFTYGKTNNKVPQVAGFGSFGWYSTDGNQTANDGLNAAYAAILGGMNHNIPASSPRSVILGGNLIKARASDPDQVYVPNLNIVGTILNDDALTEILVRDSTTGAIKYRNASSITSGSVGAPQNADKGLTPAATSGNYSSTTLAISNTPKGLLIVAVNGEIKVIGDGVKTTACYFSGDGGTTARTLATIIATDILYWNGTIVGYDLAATDEVSFYYI